MSKADTEIRVKIIQDFCKHNGVILFRFAPNSFRLKKSMHPTIDIYPKKLKTFNHEDQDWGEITDLEKFLKYQFT